MRTPMLIDGSPNSPLVGVIVRTDSHVILPDGSCIRVSIDNHQSLINRAVKGVVYEPLYIFYGKHDIELVGEEVPEIPARGVGAYNVFAMNSAPDLLYEIPHLNAVNILTGKRKVGRGFIYINDTMDEIRVFHVKASDDSSDKEDFVCVGSIDVDLPPFFASGWTILGNDFQYRVGAGMNPDIHGGKIVSVPQGGKIVPVPTDYIQTHGDNGYWYGNRHFTIQDGKIRLSIDEEMKGYVRLGDAENVYLPVTVTVGGKEYQYFIR